MVDSEDDMAEFSLENTINPYVRMMRLKRSTTMSGKWKDIDNVFTYIAAAALILLWRESNIPLRQET